MKFTTRRSWRRLAAVGTAATMAVLSMAACSGSSPEPATSSGPASITWWSWNPDDSTAPEWISDFEADHPNIQVEHRFIQYTDYVNAVRLAATSDTGPDVFGLQVGALTNQFAPVT